MKHKNVSQYILHNWLHPDSLSHMQALKNYYDLNPYSYFIYFFEIIRSIYSDVKSCVKDFGSLSEFFDSNVGLLQGKIISSLLFSLIINGLDMYLHENLNAVISLSCHSIYYCLPTMQFFSQKLMKGLKHHLLVLSCIFLKKWNLKVNISKTKRMVFR